MSGQSIKNLSDDSAIQLQDKNQWLSRAKAVGLDEDATVKQVLTAEQDRNLTFPAPNSKDFFNRAVAVGLDRNATEAQVLEAEGKLKSPIAPQKQYPAMMDFGGRARAVGLPVSATEDEIRKAEGYSRYPDSRLVPTLMSRARAVGLHDDASEKSILEAEAKNPSHKVSDPSLDVKIKDLPENNQAKRDEKEDWHNRAKAVHLKDTATLAEVIAAEKKK